MKALIKPIVLTILIFLVGSIISLFLKFETSEFLLSTLFNVSGIMFSVGIGLIATFNMNGLKNPQIIKTIRGKLSNLRNMFIVYFTISTIALILGKIALDQTMSIITIKSFSIDITFAMLLNMLFCIAYFIYNFFQLQNLNDEIYDNINN